MFENTNTHKRMMKKEVLLQAVEKAREEGIDWKIRQLEGKLACLNRKYYPNKVWDSSNGTYRKSKENKED